MKTGDKVYSSCGEIFNSDTQEDFEIGDSIYEGSVKEVSPSDLISIYSVESLIEGMEEHLYELCGEAGLGGLHISEESKLELFLTLKKFLNTNVEVGCYQVTDIVQKVLTS